LNALAKSSYENLEIIVVDNASTDGTYDAVKQKFPNVKLIRNKWNMGVTGGRNRGAKEAKGDCILFLDHDMIVNKEMVEELVKGLEADSRIGIVGSIIFYYDEPNRIWAAGTSIDMLTGKIGFNAFKPNNEPFDVQVLPAAFMVRKEVIEKVGLFDDAIFAVYEDTDFCFRIREAGYRAVCVPKAKAWHKFPADQEKQTLHILSRSYYIARNRIIFMKKHAKPMQFTIFLLLFVPVYAAYYTWLSLRRWKFVFIKEYWRGLLDGLKSVLTIRLHLPLTYTDIIARYLKDCESILDIGCGKGELMKNLKERRNVQSVGLDLYLPYLHEAKKTQSHNDLLLADAKSLPIKPTRCFEAVLCSQVLEHLEKQESLRLIDDMENLALKKVVIGTPNGFHAPSSKEIDVNPLEEHRSSFTPSEFLSRGYTVRGQGLEIVYGDKGLIRKLPTWLKPMAIMLAYIVSPLTYFMTKLATHIICVGVRKDE